MNLYVSWIHILIRVYQGSRCPPPPPPRGGDSASRLARLRTIRGALAHVQLCPCPAPILQSPIPNRSSPHCAARPAAVQRRGRSPVGGPVLSAPDRAYPFYGGRRPELTGRTVFCAELTEMAADRRLSAVAHFPAPPPSRPGLLWNCTLRYICVLSGT